MAKLPTTPHNPASGGEYSLESKRQGMGAVETLGEAIGLDLVKSFAILCSQDS